MAIIKAPPKQPKSVTIQARVEESVKMQLDQYARFIDSTPSYVITEALKVLFKRDDEFKVWLGNTPTTRTRNRIKRGSYEDRVTIMKTRPTQFGVRENAASSRRQARALQWIYCPRCPNLAQEVAVSTADSSFGIPCKRADESITSMPLDETEIVPELFSAPATVITARGPRQVPVTPEPFVSSDEAAQFLASNVAICWSSPQRHRRSLSARNRRQAQNLGVSTVGTRGLHCTE